MPPLSRRHLARARSRARRLGVEVRRSTRKHKKLDVLDPKTGRRKASIGDTRYEDFLQHGDPERRRRYKLRHQGNRHRRGSPGFYADRILW